MAIYLIRHGETTLNATRVMQHPDTPLSQTGFEQARRLAERFRGHPFARILASDYTRAQQTADALRAVTAAPLEIEPLLRERNFGALRGQSYEALATAQVDAFGADFSPPGGETWEQFHARVDRAWEKLTTAALPAGRDLAVVTHGLVCQSIFLRKAAPAPGVLPPEGAWSNTSLTVLEAPPELSAGEAWRATLVNCARHLVAPAAAGGSARA